jgi:hypothetical protein
VKAVTRAGKCLVACRRGVGAAFPGAPLLPCPNDAPSPRLHPFLHSCRARSRAAGCRAGVRRLCVCVRLGPALPHQGPPRVWHDHGRGRTHVDERLTPHAHVQQQVGEHGGGREGGCLRFWGPRLPRLARWFGGPNSGQGDRQQPRSGWRQTAAASPKYASHLGGGAAAVRPSCPCRTRPTLLRLPCTSLLQAVAQRLDRDAKGTS